MENIVGDARTNTRIQFLNRQQYIDLDLYLFLLISRKWGFYVKKKKYRKEFAILKQININS